LILLEPLHRSIDACPETNTALNAREHGRTVRVAVGDVRPTFGGALSRNKPDASYP
jgi:hypothetical protein